MFANPISEEVQETTIFSDQMITSRWNLGALLWLIVTVRLNTQTGVLLTNWRKDYSFRTTSSKSCLETDTEHGIYLWTRWDYFDSYWRQNLLSKHSSPQPTFSNLGLFKTVDYLLSFSSWTASFQLSLQGSQSLSDQK